MIARATSLGMRAARGNPRLVGTLWLLNLGLALAAAVPFWRALRDATGSLPGADALAERFSIGVVVDLTELRPGLVAGMADAAFAAAALGLLVALVATGGALEVLTSRDERPFAHRFGRGAFRFFGRFLRLGVLALALAGLATALIAGPLFALGGYLRREAGSEWLALATSLAAALAAGLVLLLVLLVQDAARVRIVREDLRRVLPALGSGFGLVLRHPAKWLLNWAWNAALLALAFAAYLALAGRLAAGAPLVALFVLQQLFVLTRCGLRVALLGAEVALVSELRPLPPSPEPLPAEPDAVAAAGLTPASEPPQAPAPPPVSPPGPSDPV